MSNNNKIFNDIRKTQSIQQPLINSNRITTYQLPKHLKQNNYNTLVNKQPLNQRYTVAAPFPPDSLLDLESTNSDKGLIPTEPKNKFVQNVKKISNKRIITSNKKLNFNTINTDGFNVNLNKKGPIDEISNNNSINNNSSYNNSNNRIIQTKTSLNIDREFSQNNYKTKYLEKDNYNNNIINSNNSGYNNTFNYSINNTLKN